MRHPDNAQAAEVAHLRARITEFGAQVVAQVGADNPIPASIERFLAGLIDELKTIRVDGI